MKILIFGKENQALKQVEQIQADPSNEISVRYKCEFQKTIK